MKVNKLNLNFFKNHKSFELETDSDVIGICGLNGTGKTNILDALYFLCIGKSYFSGTDLICIQDDEEGAGIRGAIESDELHDIKLVLKKKGRKRIEKDGKAYTKVSDHLGQFIAVIIAPGDIQLILGANETRRGFVDRILSQTNRDYLDSLVKIRKLLDQRNAHLKSDYIDHTLLDSIDLQLSPEMNYVYEQRALFFKDFIAVFQDKYNIISADHEYIQINYVSRLAQASYIELAKEARKKDIILKRSTVGIQKDEIEFVLRGDQLKRIGSQGQIKSCLIALKLAEYNYYQTKKNINPILLLDDIFEKIDDERAKALTEIIKNGTFGQLFVTDTQEERLRGFCDKINSDYEFVML